jgi:hypothetical protein
MNCSSCRLTRLDLLNISKSSRSAFPIGAEHSWNIILVFFINSNLSQDNETHKVQSYVILSSWRVEPSPLSFIPPQLEIGPQSPPLHDFHARIEPSPARLSYGRNGQCEYPVFLVSLTITGISTPHCVATVLCSAILFSYDKSYDVGSSHVTTWPPSA